MADLVRADEVQVEDLDEKTLREQKAKRAAEARQARSGALRATGAISANVGTSGLADRLQARLDARARKVINDGKAKAAVRKRLS
jgi:hypothetical protein